MPRTPIKVVTPDETYFFPRSEVRKYVSRSGKTFTEPFILKDRQLRPVNVIWNPGTIIVFASPRDAKVSRDADASRYSIERWLSGSSDIYDESGDGRWYYCQIPIGTNCIQCQECYEISDSAARKLARTAKYVIIDSYYYAFVLNVLPWQTYLAEPLAQQSNLFVYKVVWPRPSLKTENEFDTHYLGNHAIKYVSAVDWRVWRSGDILYQTLLAYVEHRVLLQHPEHEDVEVRLHEPAILLFVHKTRQYLPFE